MEIFYVEKVAQSHAMYEVVEKKQSVFGDKSWESKQCKVVEKGVFTL